MSLLNKFWSIVVNSLAEYDSTLAFRIKLITIRSVNFWFLSIYESDVGDFKRF